MDKKILVVDDDSQMRLMLRHVLGREGHAVTEAADGVAALLALRNRERFDLIIMDVIMPNKEGIETIMEARRSFPTLKIIAMSGGGRFHSYDPLQLARDCGANFTLSKPFEIEDVKKVVRFCLEEGRA